MKKPKPISIYGPKPVQAWEWALVYPAFWLIMYVIGPISRAADSAIERLPMRERGM